MISYRQADLANRLQDKDNVAKRNEFILWLNQKARGHHIYEHNFEDMQVGEHTYEGMFQVVYDAKFVKGSPMTLEEPGDADTYEIAILLYYILPGDLQDESGNRIYDRGIIEPIEDAIALMIDESMLEQDIGESLHQRDRDSD